MKKYFIEFEYGYMGDNDLKSFIVELHPSNLEDSQLEAMCINRITDGVSKFRRITKIKAL